MATASPKLQELYRQVLDQLDGLVRLAGEHDLHGVEAQRVSGWTIGKQIEHLLLSDQTLLDRFDRLIDGREGPAGGGPSLLGWTLLTLGFFPRGLGKAPAAVVPSGRDPSDIEAGLQRVRQRFDELAEHLPLLEEAGWRCRHPILGSFDVRQWMRFLVIHHRHHLKIVADIRKAAEA